MLLAVMTASCSWIEKTHEGPLPGVPHAAATKEKKRVRFHFARSLRIEAGGKLIPGLHAGRDFFG